MAYSLVGSETGGGLRQSPTLRIDPKAGALVILTVLLCARCGEALGDHLTNDVRGTTKCRYVHGGRN